MIFFEKDPSFTRTFQNPALRISIGYLIIGLAYIYYSDKIVLIIFKDPELITRIQTFKGLGFIVATASALMIYLMSTYVIKKNIKLLKKLDDNKDEYHAKLQISYNQLQMLHSELEKRVEARTSELLTANKDLRTLSSSLSHDLRTPLSSILNFARALKKYQKENTDPKSFEYINNIIFCGKQMNSLIDDMLMYSKIGREAIIFEEVNLNTIFVDVIKMLKFKIEESSALIKIPQNMPVIISNVALLTQIFSNLIENALKYRNTDSKPEINVTFEIEKNNHLTLFFKDNGIGISPENFEKVFNIFQRLHTDSEYNGTGIGLAIVKKNAELLKGTVWVESSEINKGTTFCVQLPF